MRIQVQESKRALRRAVREQLRAMIPSQRAAESARARTILTGQRIWKEAEHILFYAPLAEELDVWPLIEQALASGKTAALPRFCGDGYIACAVRNLLQEIRPGGYGIREPASSCPEVSLKRLDLVLVPGVAFDLLGRRLGRGKGHYDKILAATAGVTCGVAFDEQIVAAVPVEPHDVGLKCILTPTRWIEP